MHRPALLLGASATAFSGCVARGTLSAYSGGSPFESQKIIAATNRITLNSAQRSNRLSFYDVDVAVPKDRAVGTVPVSGEDAFSITDLGPLPDRDTLAASLSGMDRSAPLTLWVHGYNNTSAEAIYRQAQMAVDAGLTGPQVAFVWPYAATARGYVHDRDSVLHARQPFSELIDTLTSIWPGDILLVAHSLGAFLAMETLTMRARAGQSPRAGVRGLALLQPDIAVEVFAQQMRDLSPAPALTAVVAAAEDPALRLSARVSQAENRVGAFVDPAFYVALGVRLIDVSGIRDAEQPHLVAFSSPASRFFPASMKSFDHL